MRILVCGGRDFKDKNLVYKTLWPYYEEYRADLEIISGMARGADHLGWLFAHHHDLKCHEFPADWDTYGKKAGPMRNIQMLVEGKPDLVIAFPGGTGTAHMVRISKKAGVKVIEI